MSSKKVSNISKSISINTQSIQNHKRIFFKTFQKKSFKIKLTLNDLKNSTNAKKFKSNVDEKNENNENNETKKFVIVAKRIINKFARY